MSKVVKILCFVFFALFLSICVSSQAEQEYAGKPESYWINGLVTTNPAQRVNFSTLGSNDVPVMLKAVQIKDGTNAAIIRKKAATYLAARSDPTILLPLAMNNFDPQVRALALGGMMFNPQSRVTEALVRGLQDKDPLVRKSAVSSLGLTAREKTSDELPGLIKCLSDKELDIRLIAATLLCKYHYSQQDPDQLSVAKAAYAEIRLALNDPNTTARNAAEKAAQEKNPQRALETFAHELALFESESRGKQWTATIKVVDENGLPVSKASVSVTYYVPAASGGDPWSSWRKIEGITDSNGTFIASHKDSSWSVGFSATKPGYYSASEKHEFIYGGPFDQAKETAKRNPVVNLVLNKIIQPVPMYTHRLDFAHNKKPAFDQPLGFDLAAGDWVAPYGKGTDAHIFFTWHTETDTNTVPEKPGWKARPGFEQTLTITFPHSGDGILEFDLPKDIDNDVPRSELRSPQIAPESGYQAKLVKINGWHPNRPVTNNYDHVRKNYILRVATTLDEKGGIKSAQYGKIYGDFEEAFSLYFNPDPTSRSLEFDMKHNLSGGKINFYISN